jgi:hypothetical protein
LRGKDDATAPDLGHEVVAADDALPHPDEEFQQVENLRLQADEVAAVAQLAPGRIEGQCPELVEHGAVRI